MKVIGYLRVSTDGQGLGIEAQREALRAEAERRGWPEPRWVVDQGFSGGTTKRPGLQRALDDLAKGWGQGLMVAKVDRLSRSMLDFVTILERSRKQGWSLVALDLPADLSTPAGAAMANMLATFAEFERDLIRQRTREAMGALKAKGVRLGGPRMLPAKIVKRIVRERKSGATLRAIAAGLEADQVPTARGGKWAAGTIAAVLKSADLDAETVVIRSKLAAA